LRIRISEDISSKCFIEKGQKMNIDPKARAKILIEALPYFQRFRDAIIVVKYGGNAMVDHNLKENFAKDIVLMRYVGLRPIVVHGGGPQIGKYLRELGIESRFVDGIRITDERSMDVVEMVLCGKVNKEIVHLIERSGGKATGLSGKDGSLILAEKMRYYRPQGKDEPPELIDMGLVGEIRKINNTILWTLLERQFIPVIAPVGVGKDGMTYNINADTVAGQIASSLNAKKLILLTDTEGVKDRDGSLISSIDVNTATELIDSGIIRGGMIPKVRCCIDALRGGVEKSHIVDGRVEHALLLEIFTESGIGTEIIL